MKGWPQFWFGMQGWNQTEAEIKLKPGKIK